MNVKSIDFSKMTFNQFENWVKEKILENNPENLMHAWMCWWYLKDRCQEADERLCRTHYYLYNNQPEEAFKYIKEFFK